jgi:molybdenum cofactor cytidylyltransferase/nicotine blue oxidoreductase
VDPFTRVGALCVGLADQPRVGSEAYRRLATAYADGAELAVATYDGQRANPVLLARSLWAEARELTGDVGARALMQVHEVVEVPCDTTGSPADVDTTADLERLNQETP